jgi:hypothetical protein
MLTICQDKTQINLIGKSNRDSAFFVNLLSLPTYYQSLSCQEFPGLSLRAFLTTLLSGAIAGKVFLRLMRMRIVLFLSIGSKPIAPNTD